MSYIEKCTLKSPALAGELKRQLTMSDAERVAAEFLRADQLQVNNEEYLERIEGSSFNPKAARIVQILLQQTSDVNILLHALKILIDRNTVLNFPSSQKLTTEVLDSAIFWSLLAKDEAESDSTDALLQFSEILKNSKAGENASYLAIIIDIARHLHMEKCTIEKKAFALQNIIALFAIFPKEKSTEQLQLKCHGAIEKMKKWLALQSANN